MKKIFLSALSFLVLLQASLSAADESIGRIIRREGITEKSNLNCETTACDNMVIRRGDRIRTGLDSRVQVMLNDGTGIIVYERSDVIFNNVITAGKKKPTDIYVEYGKLKVIQNNNFLETSLVVRSANSIVKTVCATFCLIAGREESAIFVNTGEAGFAGIENAIANAYVIQEGEESSVCTGSKPSIPLKVKSSLQGSWLSRRILSKDKKNVLRSKIETGLMDWPFLEKD